jgi:hypothetical protein
MENEDLLRVLFEKVYVTEQVALELDAGRLLRSDTINPRLFDWITLISISQEEMDTLPPNRLGICEQSVIAYARIYANCVVGLDDRQARILAEHLGLKVVGVIGILLKAKRAGLLSSVRPFLEAAQAHGFRMAKELYEEAVRLAGEENE